MQMVSRSFPMLPRCLIWPAGSHAAVHMQPCHSVSQQAESKGGLETCSSISASTAPSICQELAKDAGWLDSKRVGGVR